MTPSRRCKKSVVMPSLSTDRHSMVTQTVPVNFQVSPLVNIVDVVKYRRNLRQDVDPQTWKRRIGRRRPSSPVVGSRDGMNNLISSESNLTTPSMAKCVTEAPIGDAVSSRQSRNGLNIKSILQVKVVIDNETPSMNDTFTTEDLGMTTITRTLCLCLKKF